MDQKQKAAGERRRELTRQIKSLDEDIERLLDRLVETQIASVSSAYEQRVQRLQREKAIAEEKQAELANKLPCFEKMFEHTIEVLSSPCDIWKKGDPTWKSAVLKAVFAERLQYRRNCGFRTPKTTFPFKVLGGSIGEDDILAERTRPGLNVLPHLNHCFT